MIIVIMTIILIMIILIIIKIVKIAIIMIVSIGNSMVSSAIWEKHVRVSFSKTYKIARVRRMSAICAFLKNS